MKKPPLIITVPTPCQESWAEMTPSEQGRFCGNCQKTVTDFSGMSDQEVVSFFSNRNGNVCGRFLPAQLDRPLLQPVESKRFHKLIASVATLVTALTMMIPSARAQKKIIKTSLTPDKRTDRDTSITSARTSGFKRFELSRVNIRKSDLPEVLDTLSAVPSPIPEPACMRVILGGVMMPGVKIEIREPESDRRVKTSIVDFF